MRRFDRQRPGRKTSNKEWTNPNDPDAKVAQAKDGATDMLYKPENVVDLDTGTILAAEVRQADEADVSALAERVIAAAALVEAIRADSSGSGQPAGGGDSNGNGRQRLLRRGGVGGDPSPAASKRSSAIHCANRRVDKLAAAQRAVVQRAKRAVRSAYGKALLRRRGMHIERSFAHILDSGGMRRATLRGQRNLDKRYKIAAATYNLSQLLRHLFGLGRPSRRRRGVGDGFFALLCLWVSSLRRSWHLCCDWLLIRALFAPRPCPLSIFVLSQLPTPGRLKPVSSTGC